MARGVGRKDAWQQQEQKLLLPLSSHRHNMFSTFTVRNGGSHLGSLRMVLQPSVGCECPVSQGNSLVRLKAGYVGTER